MTLRQRVTTWQVAAMHHALDYYGLAVKMAPFLLNSGLRVVHSRAIQTRLATPGGNTVVVTYKRQPRFAGKRIELNVNGTRHYFGPSDNVALRSLLNSI